MAVLMAHSQWTARQTHVSLQLVHISLKLLVRQITVEVAMRGSLWARNIGRLLPYVPLVIHSNWCINYYKTTLFTFITLCRLPWWSMASKLPSEPMRPSHSTNLWQYSKRCLSGWLLWRLQCEVLCWGTGSHCPMWYGLHVVSYICC